MYQLKEEQIIRLSDKALIPKDEGNRDYHEFKKWYAEGNEPEAYEPPKPTLDETKQRKFQEINAGCDSRMEIITSMYPKAEVASWYKQEAEARAFLTDSSVATTFLDGLAEGRGIDKVDLVEKIIAKADAFQAYGSRIIGQRQALEDQLNSAETVDDVENITVEYEVTY